MKFSHLILVVLSFSFSCDSFADARVVIEEGGSGSVIKIGSTWASIADQSDPDQYALINMKQKKFYMINHKDKVVIEMSEMPETKPSAEDESSAVKKPRVEVRKVGDGPRLLGYATTEYKLMANGTFCSTQYFSKDLLKHNEIKSFAEVISILSSNEDNYASPCEYAQDELDKKIKIYGIALMSKKADGSLDYKVREINFNAKYSTGDFALPRNYPIMTMKQAIEQAQKMMRENSTQPDKSPER